MTDAIDHDQGDRRDEAARTLRVSDHDVAEARRLLLLLAEAEGGASTQQSSPVELLARARAILAARRHRESAFGTAIFGEPAWEILLVLYLGASGSRRTIGGLAELARISKSTALRWIDSLDRRGLVRRVPHPTDKRAVFIELTQDARKAMDLYLSGTFALTD